MMKNAIFSHTLVEISLKIFPAIPSINGKEHSVKQRLKE
jgi:hypothetical protein